MDIKRNKRFFDPAFSKKLTLAAVLGIILALIFLALWWYIWISSIVSSLFTIGAIAGVGITIGALSIRPKVKDVNEQIETAVQALKDATAEKLKFPNDLDENSLTVWGFIEGTTEKTLKNGEKYTDRIQITSLYLKRNHLYIRCEVCSLLEEVSVISECTLPLAGMTVSINESQNTLTITSTEETVAVAIRSVDYQHEEFITKLERQVKKSV